MKKKSTAKKKTVSNKKSSYPIKKSRKTKFSGKNKTNLCSPTNKPTLAFSASLPSPNNAALGNNENYDDSGSPVFAESQDILGNYSF